MSFDKLLRKVDQAEAALEAHERQYAADWRQFKRSWRAAWTPGRIVLAGLVAGFVAGRAQPLRMASQSGGIVRIVSTLSTLLAGAGAQLAAHEAEQAADNAEDVAEHVAAPAAATTPDRHAPVEP